MANNEKAVTTSTNAVKKETGKKLSFMQRVKKWMREMKSELKKVIWPTKKQTINNTLVALVVMAVSAVGIWVFDELAQFIVRALITVAG